MKKLRNFSLNQARPLLIAATVVAMFRFMLVNAVFINFDIDRFAWFGVAEVGSGLFFSVLEGVALAYVSARWRKLKPNTRSDWVYWGILAVGQIILLGAFVFVAAFAATSVRRGLTIDQLLGPAGAVLWSFLVVAINPLLVILIGIVDDDHSEVEQGQATALAAQQRYGPYVRQGQARGLLEEWQRDNGTQTPRIGWLIEEFGQKIGGELATDEADAAIVAWRSRNGIAGRRPKEMAGNVEIVGERVTVERVRAVNGKGD